MKRLFIALVGFFCVHFFATAAFGGGVAFRLVGTTRLIFPPPGSPIAVGELIQCDLTPGPGFEGPLVHADIVFAQFQRICDDRGDRPCNGALIGIIELCALDRTPYMVGTMEVGYGDGNALRICHDPTGGGSCTADEEVATGTTGGFSRNVAGGATGHSNAVFEIDRGKRFKFDGSRVRVKNSTSITSTSSEQPVGDPPNNCLFTPDGCGFAGIGVELRGGDDDDDDDDD